MAYKNKGIKCKTSFISIWWNYLNTTIFASVICVNLRDLILTAPHFFIN